VNVLARAVNAGARLPLKPVAMAQVPEELAVQQLVELVVAGIRRGR
jgi:hypothetical protein